MTDVGPQLTSRHVGKVTIITDRWACAGADARPHPFESAPKTIVSLDANGALAYAPTATPLRRTSCPVEAGPLCPRCSSVLGSAHWQAVDALGTQLCISCLPTLLRQGLGELDESRERLAAYVAENADRDTSVYDIHHGGRQVNLAREVLRVDAEEWGRPLIDPIRRALQAVARGPEHERKAVAELLTEILADAPKGKK